MAALCLQMLSIKEFRIFFPRYLRYSTGRRVLMDITISWTIIKAGQHTESFHWVQYPYFHPVCAMSGGKTGSNSLFHLDQFFFLKLSTHCTKLPVAWKYFIQGIIYRKVKVNILWVFDNKQRNWECKLMELWL